MDGNFPPKCSTNGSYGKIPKDANPTNQTSITGKIPKGLNPPKILCNSFESKEPLVRRYSFKGGHSTKYLIQYTQLDDWSSTSCYVSLR